MKTAVGWGDYMFFSRGGSVNTVSDGSLITKGLPLVQYRTALERLLSAQNCIIESWPACCSTSHSDIAEHSNIKHYSQKLVISEDVLRTLHTPDLS